jgi:hypothetical protein
MPCENCPSGAIWELVADAANSPEPVIRTAGMHGQAVLEAAVTSQIRPTVEIIPGLDSSDRPAVTVRFICCTPAAEHVKDTIIRAEHITEKNNLHGATQEPSQA